MKRIFTLLILTVLSVIQAQVGINTTKPQATLDIEAIKGAETNGILIPRVNTTDRSAFTKPENGLMIYNTDLKCYEINVGTPVEPSWECVATAKNVQTVSIEPRGFKGNFRYGIGNDPNTHKVLFEVTNNTSSQLTGIDLSYINVDGRAQFVARGQNDNVTIPANQSVVLEYGISGVNLSNTSTFNLTYDQYSSASIVLKVDNENFDENLHGIGDGGTAEFVNMEKDFFLVNYQGAANLIDESITITAANPLIVQLEFTQGIGNYLAYTSPEIEITDANGQIRKIQLSYPEGNLDIGTGNIEATISSVDGNDLTLPQTTLGGRDLIARIPIQLNDTDKGNYDIYAFGGIPDKRFGDGSGHDFVYMPVVSPTGRVWLNNNLGAEYNRVASDVFDPTQQATELGDIYALGSRFQFRRYSDGHELYSVENGVYNPISSNSYVQASNFQPNTSIIYLDPLSKSAIPKADREYNWVEKSYITSNQSEWENLWTLEGANNPCPDGFRPPLRTETTNEINYLDQKSEVGLFESPLKFVTNYKTTYTWHSERYYTFVGNSSNVYNNQRTTYQSQEPIRCIKAN